MKSITIPTLAVVLVLLVVTRSAFIIDQAQQGIIVQFGEPIGDVITEPGLHWRLPFIQEVRRFDKRLLDWDGDVTQIPTLGREFIIVDTTARWWCWARRACSAAPRRCWTASARWATWRDIPAPA